MIQDVVDDRKLANLICEKITETVEEYQKTNSKKQKNALEGMLKKEFIQMCHNQMTWKEAMYKSAEPLEKKGYIEPRYIEKSIEHVEEYGDYIVVSEGVGLAYANKDFGVHQDCLSLLVSKDGIQFTEKENKVYLLFCFASIGDKDYLEILKAIVQLGKKQGNAKKISMLQTVDQIFESITCS